MAFNRGPGGSQSGASDIEDTPVTIAQGGTSATTAAQARTNLGIGTMGTQPSNSVFITGGSITGISPLPVASGGTGASGQAEARANLGISTAATQATEYFATAAQGTLADSAVQPGDLATVATTGAYSDLSGTPSLATVATSGSYTDLNDKPTIPVDLDDLGDVVITSATTNQVLAYDGTNWVNANAGAGSGDVVGPASSTDNAVVLFDGTTGKLVKDGGVLGTAAFDDTGDFATSAQGTNADTAFGWGDHAGAGYLTSFTETDPVVGAITGIVKADGAGNISAAVAGTDYLASETYTGTVTSVEMTVPTGLAVSGNPVTSSGTLAVTYSAGYSIPTTTKQGEWDDAYTFTAAFPSQTSQSGKYLTTDGSVLSWATVDALPSQTGNSGKYLTTDGSTASWAVVSGGQYLGTAATKAIMYNAQSIAENITIDGTYNALSAGPITIDSTYTVTVSSGAVWTIV
jgi:hypothetical protein